MADLLARLLDPAQVDAALGDFDDVVAEVDVRDAIRELHRRLASHERYLNKVFEVTHQYGWPRDENRDAVFLFFDKVLTAAKAEGAAVTLRSTPHVQEAPMKCTNHIFDGWEDSTPCRREAIKGSRYCLSCIPKQDLMKAYKRLRKIISELPCTCYCGVHGRGCGAQEATCREIVRCARCLETRR